MVGAAKTPSPKCLNKKLWQIRIGGWFCGVETFLLLHLYGEWGVEIKVRIKKRRWILRLHKWPIWTCRNKKLAQENVLNWAVSQIRAQALTAAGKSLNAVLSGIVPTFFRLVCNN